jgi:hypothetical protein
MIDRPGQAVTGLPEQVAERRLQAVNDKQAMHDLSQAEPTHSIQKSPAIAKDDRPRIFGSAKERKTARASGRRNALPVLSGVSRGEERRNAEAGSSGCRLHRIARPGQ